MSLPPPPRSYSTVSQTSAPRAAISYDADQLAAINCRDHSIVVNAFAGAGKTTMAVGFAEKRPDERILYLCFGKANQVEAQSRFPTNTESRTGHSLAYGWAIRKYSSAGFPEQLTRNWKTRDFAAEMGYSNNTTAAIVKEILSVYMTSADDTVLLDHFGTAIDKFDLSPEEIKNYLPVCKLAWSKMCKPGSGVKVPPDAYLKMWALTRPKLDRYSHIILDEGQDTNAVMVRVVEEQTNIKKLIIGDRHQNIFLFRGATNALDRFAAFGATVLAMPTTWRFGKEIASVNNDILSFFKGEKVKIIGAGPAGARRQERKKAVLSRTNAGLFGEAAAVMGRDTHWMGGIEKYRIDLINDSYLLKQNRIREVRDPVLRSYNSWSQFVEETLQTKDGEGKMLIKLNDQYGKDVPMLVDKFRANALPTEQGAKLVLSTIHSAKGMDWDTVQMSDDFSPSIDALDAFRLNPTAPLSPLQIQEINLLYVLTSRARHELILNKDTRDFINKLPLYRSEMTELVAKHQRMNKPPSGYTFQPHAENEQIEIPTS